MGQLCALFPHKTDIIHKVDGTYIVDETIQKVFKQGRTISLQWENIDKYITTGHCAQKVQEQQLIVTI